MLDPMTRGVGEEAVTSRKRADQSWPAGVLGGIAVEGCAADTERRRDLLYGLAGV
jgi:hypothetical protein